MRDRIIILAKRKKLHLLQNKNNSYHDSIQDLENEKKRSLQHYLDNEKNLPEIHRQGQNATIELERLVKNDFKNIDLEIDLIKYKVERGDFNIKINVDRILSHVETQQDEIRVRCLVDKIVSTVRQEKYVNLVHEKVNKEISDKDSHRLVLEQKIQENNKTMSEIKNYL